VSVTILEGDCRIRLAELPDCSVNTCVTSPPYFGLRDYGVDGQMGLEPTPDEFVAGMVAVFAEVRRVLRDDGTLWLNIGDSYAGSWGNYGGKNRGKGSQREITSGSVVKDQEQRNGLFLPPTANVDGCKPKDLIGIPWMLAFALRADGWYLRSDIIWAKPNGMPESVRDRPTRSHEMVFLLSKSPRYYYDAEALRTPPQPSSETRLAQNVEGQAGSDRANGGAKTNGPMKAVARASDKQRGHTRRHDGFNDRWDAMERAEQLAGGANLKSVWWLAPAQFRDSHFATMPAALAEICIAGGCPVDGTVLDPFFGAGTTGLVADRLQRGCIGIELNPEYAEIARKRLAQDGGMFAEVLAA
jgi:DNA modification methylase